MVDVCVIGHITRDVIRIGRGEKDLPGGVAYYFSMAFTSLGGSVSVITKCAEEDTFLLNDLVKRNIDIFYSQSKKTTTFENVYPEDLDSRMQKVTSIATPFTVQEIPSIFPRYFHLGPLTNRNISLDVLRVLSRQAKVSLDIQGCLRTIDKGMIRHGDWQEKDEGLTYVNILKADEDEAKILSGEENIERAAERLATYGIDEIVITLGRKGSLIYSKGAVYRIPSFPAKKMVDPTGCGDTYIAGYLFKRLRSSAITEAGQFAAAMASLKLGGYGPFTGSEEDVAKFLEASRAL
ncbi:MAG: carbohydrate kinase family protein [Candidatus Methylomirabilales bacterium]